MRLQVPDPNDLQKRYGMVRFLISVALVVQVIILLAYYFKEKQTILSFPMIVNCLFLGLALTHLRYIKPRE